MTTRIFLIFVALFVFACTKSKIELPAITEEPLTTKVLKKDLADLAPAYGIARGGGSFEVSIEPSDSQKLKVNSKAFVSSSNDPEQLECRVSSVTRSASSEVGQAIAWLQNSSIKKFKAGDFVVARIVLNLRKATLSVPRESIYIKDGAKMVLRQTKAKDGKIAYTGTEVETGIETDKEVEILSGLSPDDVVLVKGGIGYLFPNFKEADD